jgi:DNA-binding LacI/PurR family transcriptional regulator
VVITANDYFARGVYLAVRERGLAVPDDVRVLGYGDHPFAANLEPALTTIRLPADEVGTAALDLLLRRIAEPDRPGPAPGPPPNWSNPGRRDERRHPCRSDRAFRLA